MKIAITGASGHIGNLLLEELISKGHNVRALVHVHADSMKDGRVDLVKGDLLDTGSLDQLCQDRELVYHLAARISIKRNDKDLVWQTNVEGTRNLVSACMKAGVKRLVHFSSIHALQAYPLDSELDESRELGLQSPMMYERSKAHSEMIVLEAASAGLDAVILNPTAVIGPGDIHGSFLGNALILMYRNALPMLVKGGYDWVDVRDVVSSAMAAMTEGKPGERYLLPGHWLSLLELAQFVSSISGRPASQWVAPDILAKLGLPFISAWAAIRGSVPLYTAESLSILRSSHQNISGDRAAEDLGHSPRPIEETLKDTFDWYTQHGHIR